LADVITAIVLRKRDSGESDRRLTLLSRERGRLDVIAKGARKPQSRLAGVSEPLTVATFGIAEGRQRTFIQQVVPEASFAGLRQDYDRLSYALALTEFYAAVLTEGTSAEAEFQELLIALTNLEHHERPMISLVWSLLRILELEGVGPQFLVCSVTGAKLTEDPAMLSPTAGGHVLFAEAQNFSDARPVDARYAIALGKLACLDRPPNSMLDASLVLRALAPFLFHHAHAPLANLKAILDQ
jgi:DNA repair protein RecO (recombination protein O)